MVKKCNLQNVTWFPLIMVKYSETCVFQIALDTVYIIIVIFYIFYLKSRRQMPDMSKVTSAGCLGLCVSNMSGLL
jgi:hypothetical protein